jgi:hypothetical protein
MNASPTSPDHEEDPPDPTGADAREARLLLMRQLIHDLNNALSVISVNVTLLARGDGNREQAAELLEEVARAGARASTLTGQLRRCVAESSDPFRSSSGG